MNNSSRPKRTANFLLRHRWFSLFVALPVLLAVIYYGLFASDVYVSEARFVIKSPSQRPAQLSTIANLLQTSGLSSGQEQANEVLDHLRSRDALIELRKHADIRAMYANPQADFLSRYPTPWWPDRFETLYKYYGNMIEARFDNDTGAAVLTVKAFRPADAYKINSQLLELSERFVNRLSDRAQTKGIAEAERRVADAEGRLRKAHFSLAQYRNAKEIIDPGKQAAGVIEVSNRLEAEQAGLRAQLDLMERVAPDNPTIPSLRRRIAAIGAQISAQNGRAVGTSTGIASKMGEYENLVTEQEFATQMLTAADASLAQARADSQKQQFYLERIVEPNTPDMALLPHRLRQILVVAAAALCAYMIGWMLLVGILEHSPED